jgi:hypothetical protein
MKDDDGRLYWCSLDWGGAGVMFYSAESLDSPPGPPAMTGVLYFNPVDVKGVVGAAEGCGEGGVGASGDALRDAGVRDTRLQWVHLEFWAGNACVR